MYVPAASTANSIASPGHSLRCVCRAAVVAIAVLVTTAFANEGAPHDDAIEPVVLAPGYGTLPYDPPQPGSYRLPHLGAATDGEVLDSNGDVQSLAGLLAGRISVVGFVYRACDDVNGCPLITHVMRGLRAKLDEQAVPGEQRNTTPVQLVTMSFDPEHDTPVAMAALAESLAAGSDAGVDTGVDTGDDAIDTVAWRFLTSRSVEALAPLLEGWGQPVSRAPDDRIEHVLRVYLVDATTSIRNIYSASLLHEASLLSDVATLVQEASASHATPAASDTIGGAPDEPFDLVAHARAPSLGLPAMPGADALTAERVALGRQLFFDRRLSVNDTFSCAMCHVPSQGFASNDLATSVGVEGRTVKRNAPTLLNVGFLPRLFHDSRERTLEQQVWSPLLAHNEMANPSIGHVLDKVAAIDDYADRFEEAFGSRQPTMQSLADALAAYERTLVAADSAFDRWLFGKDKAALSAEAARGYALFVGKAGCAGCHLIGQGDASFSDDELHNTGIGYARSMNRRDEPHPVQLAPGVIVMVDPASYAAAAETPPNDLGRYEITGDPADRWKFRTPGLRNVALTAPYMHDGSIATLAEVVAFYDAGGIENPLLAPQIKPLELDQAERLALVAFLASLTGAAVPALVADARSVRIGDVDRDDVHVWSRRIRE